MGWIIAGAVALGLLLWYVGVYNKLIDYRERVNNAWAQIDTQLLRRFDLIPNLVETVKAYASHESDTLERVIAARTQYMSANGNIEQAAQAENMLSGTLKSIMALSEAYPELKANVHFQDLMTELTGTEDKVAFARQFYNDTVKMYNVELDKFPNNIVVSISGADKFPKRSFFEATAEEKKNVRVQF